MKKVKFLTLGCRLNQYETQAVREDLLRKGYEEVEADEKTDLFVINTCTVTNDADRDSRYLIRKCHRENPDAKIVVTGCYAERDHKTIAEMPGVTHVVLNRQKPEIASLLESCATFTYQSEEHPLPSKANFVPLRISDFAEKTRAFVKIQDGCNHACSFCKVVLVRGKSRSRSVPDILEEVKRLGESGALEIVLTGIQLGAYGLDLDSGALLHNVIREISKIDSIHRIRLSSIEPNDVTDELIDVIKHTSKACHHLHIPLQSGSNEILERMNRRYAREKYIELIQKLRSELSEFVLTTDVMAGFPGETDEYFHETIQTLIETKPFKLHIFPYSAREGTKAFSWPAVDSQTLKRRMSVLYELEKKLRFEKLSRYPHQEINIIIEKEEAGILEGRASNYLPVQIPVFPGYQRRQMIPVRVNGFSADHLLGVNHVA